VTRGAAKLDLILQADGYAPVKLQVTPDHDQHVKAKLKRKAANGAKPRDRNSLEYLP
jgi:hypothetical protein